jgi:hypothetical protein
MAMAERRTAWSVALAAGALWMGVVQGCSGAASQSRQNGRSRPRAVQPPDGQSGSDDDPRSRVVRFAQEILRGAPLKARGVDFPPDPVGFVRACFWHEALELYDPRIAATPAAEAMQTLYRSAAERGWLHTESPQPGDLIFFDPNDRNTALYPTQVAIIETLDVDGTITAIGAFAQGPERVRLNLRDPDNTTAADGRQINDLLAGDATLTAAQLFRAFADPFRDR